MEVESDRPPRIKVYHREHPSLPLGELIGQFEVNGDFRLEHLVWALLAEESASYPPHHVIELREWSSDWGAFTSGIDIVIEVMNSPYVSGVLSSLATMGLSEATRRVVSLVRSEPITEDQAIHHAMQWALRYAETSVHDVVVEAHGVYPKATRWVRLRTPKLRLRVAVALTNKGGVSVATESVEFLDPPGAN